MHCGTGKEVAKRRITDGTSEKELMKAMSTFLNKTGAGDYNLPVLTGENIIVSNKKNQPNWSLKDRTKLSWFAGRDVDFRGCYSPPATVYSPKADRDYQKTHYSVGKNIRFHKPSSVNKLHYQIPHQYKEMSDGLDPKTGPKNYNTNKVAVGYGQKHDFTNQRELFNVPGPVYDNHNKNSISYISANKHKTLSGFYNKYDKWQHTCYGGMDHDFYGREGKGPGAYLKTDFVATSPTKIAAKFSVPRNDRGLLVPR